MRVFGNTGWVSLAALALCLPAMTSAQQLDILGLRLGMAMSEATAKIGSGYKLSPLQGKNTHLAILIATKYDDAWALAAFDGKVAYIEHYSYFKESEPQIEDTRSRLLQKYGPMTSDARDMSWAYTSSGSPMTAPPARDCANRWVTDGFTLPPQGPPPSQSMGKMFLPTVFPVGCQIALWARPDSGMGPAGMVQQLTISLVNLEAFAKDRERLAREQGQQEKNALDKAKQNKAPF